METNEGDKFEVGKRDASNSMMHNSPSISSDWQFVSENPGNAPTDLIPTNDHMLACSSAPMVDSFGQTLFNQSGNPQSMGLSCILSIQNIASNSNSPAWNSPSLMSKDGLFFPNAHGILPHSLPQFPADSGFIERAARFSCFSSGNFGAMVNHPFGLTESIGPCSRGGGMTQGPQDASLGNGLKRVSGGQSPKNELNFDELSRDASPAVVEHKETEVSPIKNDTKVETIARSHEEMNQSVPESGNELGETDFTDVNLQEQPSSLEGTHGEPSVKGASTKKRKRQDTGPDQSQGAQEHGGAGKDTSENKQNDNQNLTSTGNKSYDEKNGKQGSQASDPPKEYIHVRARRGQATNSHSLAERVRREKISERMKLLQDLVPGCNKVTGKAVMLDEIINYVQSLQRQVEFLSMKLATVSPRLDFNIEGLVAKDTPHLRPGPSSILGFPQDVLMACPPLHPSEPGLIPLTLSGMGNSSDVFRRTVSSDLQSISGAMSGALKEQLPGAWEDELHNIVHMSYGTAASDDNQDPTGALPPGRTKVKL